MLISQVKTIEQKVKDYDNLRKKKKQLEDQMKLLSQEIKDYSSIYGTKDDKGSCYVDSPTYTFGTQCKKSIKLNGEKALDFFKTHNLEKYIKTQEYVDETTVEALSQDGTISYDDLESMCNIKTTYSVLVTKKEEVTAEVEEHEVASMPIAASKKPKLKLSRKK